MPPGAAPVIMLPGRKLAKNCERERRSWCEKRAIRSRGGGGEEWGDGASERRKSLLFFCEREIGRGALCDSERGRLRESRSSVTLVSSFGEAMWPWVVVMRCYSHARVKLAGGANGWGGGVHWRGGV